MPLLNALFTIKNTALVVMMFAFALFLFKEPKGCVVTFDKESVVKQWVKQLSVLKLNPDKTKTLSSQFAKALKQSLDAYSKKHHVIIIKKEHVLVTHADVTSEIAQNIAHLMRGAS